MAQIKNDKGTTTSQFNFVDHRILIPTFINRCGPFHMIFDTGGVNILTPDAAKRLNLNPIDAGTISGAGEKMVSISHTLVDIYKIGDLKMINQEFLVINLDQIKDAFRFENLDGILGFEILQSFAVTIDYNNEQISFTDFKKFKGLGNVIDFEVESKKLIAKIEIEIEGVVTNAVIDTGNRSSFTIKCL